MRVLFVDAGNYCRSPVAEIVARALATRAGATGWTFSSAGLKDKHAGDSADPRSIAACAARGYDLTAFRCREITAADFAAHDLVLAMDRDNAAQLEARRPPGSAVPIRLFLDDREVPDPYYGGDDGFEAMMAQVEEGVRALLGGGGRGG
ncbi:low molecular weight protein-tyrosine-phosphatase [Flavobacterium sp.]|uniref:low molecular weight protein-tyrosine-phosphatase n=1 Tax=Flavobacterium sp. TaxID=239 RepID=UPI0037BED829